MKKLFVVASCLLMLSSSPAWAQGQAQVAVVRIFETGPKVRVVITRGEGQNEELRFDAGFYEKGLAQSSDGYYKLFSKLYQEGYTVQSTFSSPIGPITLLFVKAPKP